MAAATVAAIVASIPPRRQMLAEALASVCGQTWPVDEIRVAVDVTGEGPAATRNRALEGCCADWVAFLDDDDWWKPDHIASLVECAEQSGADVVYPWFDVIGGTDPFAEREGRPFDAAAAVELHARNWIPVTFLARRTIVDQAGRFPPPTAPRGNQEEWGLQVAMLDCGATFAHLPHRTWCWRHWGGNTSGRPWPLVLGTNAV